jgi:hypothetical protein
MKVPVSNILIVCAAALVAGVVVISMTANNANSQTPLADLLYGPAAEKSRDGLPPIDAAQPRQFETATFAVG